MKKNINHIAIIPDGNRRYARKNKLSQKGSYDLGNEKIKLCIDYCIEKKINYMSIFLLSIDNIYGRSEEELDIIFSLAEKEIEFMLNSNKKYYARFIISEQDKIPECLLKKMKLLCETQDKYIGQLCVNFYIGYGSHESLIKSINQLIEDKEEINIKNLIKKSNENIIEDNIETPFVDILIRTSGEKRLSNYLLVELKYAEIFFIEKYWPEINVDDLENTINLFIQIEQRFGK